jgi:hypothetical protein
MTRPNRRLHRQSNCESLLDIAIKRLLPSAFNLLPLPFYSFADIGRLVLAPSPGGRQGDNRHTSTCLLQLVHIMGNNTNLKKPSWHFTIKLNMVGNPPKKMPTYGGLRWKTVLASFLFHLRLLARCRLPS